jgi:hypothetical protein
MASRVLVRTPWLFLDRTHFRLDSLKKSVIQSKHHFSVAFQLNQDTPAAQALKGIPYPTTALDSSVFEESLEEYDVVARSSIAQGLPKTSIETLIHLVEIKCYKTAERIRSELVQMGVEIPLNAVYEKAAIEVLRIPKRENLAEAFAGWFSLVPMAQDSKPRSFSTITQLIFHKSLLLDIPLIRQFGLICASKGYAKKVALQVISHIVRYADPSVSGPFLNEFETLATQYQRKFYPDIKKTLKYFRDIAIRNHCLAGRPAEAIKIFQASRASKIGISRATSAFLIRKLESSHDPANEKIIAELRYQPHFSRTTTATFSESPLLPGSLASKARILRKSLISNQPPSAHALCIFMSEYRATGRTVALSLLRKKAFQHTHRSIRLWVTAEMLYYAERNQHANVVFTFAAYFHLVGVPQDVIERQLERSSEIRDLRLEDQRGSFLSLVPRQYPMAEKIAPSPLSTVLVWQSLATLSRGANELWSLYRQLLHFARLSNTSPSPPTSLSPLPPSLSQSPPAHPPILMPAPARAVHQGHFTPFLRLFRERSGPHRALAVVADMLSLGIQPTQYHYAALANSFARMRNVEFAMALLGRSERAAKGEVVDGVSSDGLSSKATMLRTYTKIMRAFLDAKCLDAAVRVDDRIRRAGYVPGSNLPTDRARAVLQFHLRRKVRLLLLFLFLFVNDTRSNSFQDAHVK